MSTPQIVLGVIQMIAAIIIILVVVLQEGNQKGLSGTIAGGAETFFGKNKGKTIEAKLAKWTVVVAAAFLLLTIALGVVVNFTK